MKKILLTTILGFVIAMNAMAHGGAAVLLPEEVYLRGIVDKGYLTDAELEEYIGIMLQRDVSRRFARDSLTKLMHGGLITVAQKQSATFRHIDRIESDAIVPLRRN